MMSDTLKNEISGEIKFFTYAGFFNRHQVFEQVTDMFTCEDLDEVWMQEMIDYHIVEKSSLEGHWPKTTDFDLLVDTFYELNRKKILTLHMAGYTRQDGESDCYAVQSSLIEKGICASGYCFYHMQDVEKVIFDQGAGLFLAFGSFSEQDMAIEEVGNIIVDELKHAGFEVEWNGDVDKRILIAPFNWQKRFVEFDYTQKSIDLICK
jgi:hypothetical protein